MHRQLLKLAIVPNEADRKDANRPDYTFVQSLPGSCEYQYFDASMSGVSSLRAVITSVVTVFSMEPSAGAPGSYTQDNEHRLI